MTDITTEAADIFQVARDTIQPIVSEHPPTKDLDITDAYELSTSTLGEYVTLDDDHRSGIDALKQRIGSYAADPTVRRPLNFVLLAEPGIGKSFFVESLAKKMPEIHDNYVGFNMANMESLQDFVPAVDQVRNLRVKNRLPLLFLDEFDSKNDRLTALLPLLWDGELHVNGRHLRFGKAVVALAGSTPALQKTLKDLNQQGRPGQGKVVDLLSRVNAGVLEIPKLDLFNDSGRDRRIDKVCIFIALLRARFGSHVAAAPVALLSWVGRTKFRYAVRSMAFLVDLLRHPTAQSGTEVTTAETEHILASDQAIRENGLVFHLDEETPGHALESWKKKRGNKAVVRFGKTASLGDRAAT